jgi:hypothetical protein
MIAPSPNDLVIVEMAVSRSRCFWALTLGAASAAADLDSEAGADFFSTGFSAMAEFVVVAAFCMVLLDQQGSVNDGGTFARISEIVDTRKENILALLPLSAAPGCTKIALTHGSSVETSRSRGERAEKGPGRQQTGP